MLTALPDSDSSAIKIQQFLLLCLLWCYGNNTDKSLILFNILNSNDDSAQETTEVRMTRQKIND